MRHLRLAWGAATSASLMLTSVASRADDASLVERATEDTVESPAEPVDLSEPAPAPVPSAAPAEGTWLDAPPRRRCGFNLGLHLGPMLGGATGYPNDALEVNREEFRTDTGAAFGGNLGIWIGITLADWFTVGLGPSFGRLQNGDTQTRFFALGFHLDVFPAFGLGGAWEDLGLTIDAGLGGATTNDAESSDDVLIEAPIASRLGVGGFWEGIQVWKLSMGPFASFDAMWSPSSLRPTGWFGWRTAFYAGP
ncbi:MAG TPA: hypothetical protein ENK57_16285 [Polyangiaceae bacterium]|nr:hypothetical protein [Polyangiaceae bacterium]